MNQALAFLQNVTRVSLTRVCDPIIFLCFGPTDKTKRIILAEKIGCHELATA